MRRNASTPYSKANCAQPSEAANNRILRETGAGQSVWSAAEHQRSVIALPSFDHVDSFEVGTHTLRTHPLMDLAACLSVRGEGRCKEG